MSVLFTDNSVHVMDALNDAAIAYLYEASGEIVNQTKRNMPPGGDWYTQQKNAWQYKVDEGEKVAVIGNPMEQMLWTEFGTGEHALHKNGRKGYWVYVKNSNGVKSTNPQTYTLEEAKRIVAMMREDGLDAHYTNGQEPKRPFFKAFNSLKPKLIQRAEKVIGGKMNE